MKLCAVICASPYNQPEFIKEVVQKTDFVICADGGFDTAMKSKIKPDIIIGDFDSQKTQNIRYNNEYSKIVLPVEKDDTDSISCLRYAISKGYDNFVILGATGGRTDHMYANFYLLKFLCGNGCKGVIKDEFTDIHYTEDFLILNEKGKTISVLPFGCESANVTLNGFKYKADNLVMTSDFPIGISNIAESDVCTVKVSNGGVMVIVNRNLPE